MDKALGIGLIIDIIHTKGSKIFAVQAELALLARRDDVAFIKLEPHRPCNGTLRAAILGTEEFDVTTIDPDTLRLTREGFADGVAPVCYNFTDGEVGDIVLKFRVPEVVDVLMLEELAGETAPLIITGETVDGTVIRDQDSVRLFGNIVEEYPSDYDCDADVDGSDAITFKDNFGRCILINPCTEDDPCDGNYDGDNDVDGNDALTFKSDFGFKGWW